MSLFNFLLLFYVLSFVIRTDNSLDVDLGRHIKIGEIVIKEGVIPKLNLFSYTNPDFPHINLQYLFGVFVYLGQQIIGLQSLIFFKIIIILFSVALIFLIIGKKFSILVLPIGFIFLHLLRDRIELRPELISFLFTSLTYFILNTYEREKTRLVFLLPLIQLVWINFHIYFVIGLILQTGFLIHFLLRKELVRFRHLSIILISSLFLSLINPYHLEGLLYPFNVFKNYAVTVQENQNIFYLEKLGIHDRNFLFLKISAALVVVSLIVGFFRKSLTFKNIFLPLAGLILGLVHIRSIPYLIFLSLPGTIQNFAFIKPKFISIFMWLITVLILLLESLLYLNGYYYKFTDSKNRTTLKLEEHYKKGLDFVIDHNLKGPIFNNFDIGGYIIYRLYPGERVFVDSRAEAYPRDFYSYEYATNKGELEDFLSLDKMYKFNTIIFVYSDLNPWERSFSKLILNEKEWGLVYLGDYVSVFTRRITGGNNLSEINLEQLTPDQYMFGNHNSYLRIATYLFNAGFTSTGLKFVQKALEIFPDSPFGNYLIGRDSQNHIWW